MTPAAQRVSWALSTLALAAVVAVCWIRGLPFMSAAPLIFGLAVVIAIIHWLVLRRIRGKNTTQEERKSDVPSL